MSRFSDLDFSAPNIPGETCPIINEVQEGLAQVIKDLESAAKQTEDGDTSIAMEDAARAISELSHDNPQLKSPLERVRSANEDLREVGKYWREKAKELCAALDEIQQTLRSV
jgi:uncharacterized protein YukE